MNRRLRCLAWLVEMLLLLAGVYFEPTCCVRGALRGEAFFGGKPTSWWRRELDQWEISDLWFDRHHLFIYQRDDTHWLDRLKMRGWLFWQPSAPRVLDARGPDIIHDQPEARAVLTELLEDPSPKIRRFARIGLKMETNGD